MWLRCSVRGRASHRYRGDHGFESLEPVIFFQASSFLLLKDVRTFSNTDFFLKILPLKDDELVMSEM